MFKVGLEVGRMREIGCEEGRRVMELNSGAQVRPDPAMVSTPRILEVKVKRSYRVAGGEKDPMTSRARARANRVSRGDMD